MASKERNQADEILELVERDLDTIFFHDGYKNAQVRFKVADHFEIWSCRSKQFKLWLGRLFHQEHLKISNTDALKAALSIIEGKCVFEGDKIVLHNRVAWSQNELWYDLSNPTWQAVVINERGWSVCDESPILFRRYPHQGGQVTPSPIGGDVSRILKYINITDPERQLLLLTLLVSSFIPGFPHPILIIHGPQGAAKSMLCKILGRIIDPSLLDAGSFPKSEDELIQVLNHHWAIYFDNVSYLPHSYSDILCKAVTGSGFSKRELYSDDNDIIYNFKRCVGLNGINVVANKPDLLERAILLELERISEEQRKQEALMWEEFDKDLPIILGGIFDVLVKAIGIKPLVTREKLPRMADFAIWGCAIAEALGHKQQDFLDAYYKNIGQQNQTILNDSILAVAIIGMMEDLKEWEGTASKLQAELKTKAVSMDIDVRDKEWPKGPNKISQELNRIKTNLENAGIKVIKRPGGRKIQFLNMQKSIDSIVTVDENTDFGGF